MESWRYERPLGTRDKLALSGAEREESSSLLEYYVDSKAWSEDEKKTKHKCAITKWILYYPADTDFNSD